MRINSALQALLFIASLAGGAAYGLDGQWQVADGDWNVEDNWLVDGVPTIPDAAFGDNATIGNGGTANVTGAVPSVSSLNVNNGIVSIHDGGSLGTISDDQGTGNLNVAASGSLLIASGGTLNVAGSASNSGLIGLTGSDAALDIAGGFTASSGSVVEANIRAATHSPITVGGSAVLGGAVRPTFDGVVPAYGNSWDILTADSIVGNFAVDTSAAPPLLKGLIYQSEVSGNTARLAVTNTLLLTVDRVTGGLSVSNPAGGGIDVIGYAIESPSGLLNVGGFAGLEDAGVAGWREANLTTAHLAELNLTGASTLDVGASQPLGSGFTPGPQKPSEEDVTFSFVTSDFQIRQGIVEYSGPANDIVLNVDPATGEMALSHLSPFAAEIDLTGYNIFSSAGSLDPGGWTSFEDNPDTAGPNWREANPTDNHISELNLLGAQHLANGTLLNLGTLLTVGDPLDLVFEYSTLAGEVLQGTVQYGAIPDIGGFLESDFNEDGMVNLADFNVLKANFGGMGGKALGDANMDNNINLQDFNILKSQFGQSMGGAPVPEPSTMMLLACGAVALLAARGARSRIRR